MVARPLGLSWPRLGFYSPVSGNDMATEGSTTSPSEPRRRFGPSVLLSSKRLRLWVPVAVVFLILILLGFGHRYDALPNIPAGWTKGNDDKGSATPPPPVTPTKPAKPTKAATPKKPGAKFEPNGDIGAAVLDAVDWSRFAYVQYVTNSQYLCNTVMLLEQLHKLGSRADRVVMFPSTMFDPDTADSNTRPNSDAQLLMKARDEYKAHLVPIAVQRRNGGDQTWAESFTKLLAFNQTQYDRVLSLDSDAVMLRAMDELFLLPMCPMAMPRAYWLYPDKRILTSLIMLVQPNAAEFARVMAKVEAAAHDDYDMEIVNYLYRDSSLVLPHRRYAMLTSEFRNENHTNYLGSDSEEWDPVAAYNEAKFVHFSDWPVPKPWIPMGDETRLEKQPKCELKNGVESCAARDIWNGFYTDFAERRQRVCSTDASRKRGRRLV